MGEEDEQSDDTQMDDDGQINDDDDEEYDDGTESRQSNDRQSVNGSSASKQASNSSKRTSRRVSVKRERNAQNAQQQAAARAQHSALATLDGAGSSCHQCKSRRSNEDLTHCTSSLNKKNKAAMCRKKYCSHCLTKFYNEQPMPGNVQAGQSWKCPACRKICCCAACRRRDLSRSYDGRHPYHHYPANQRLPHGPYYPAAYQYNNPQANPASNPHSFKGFNLSSPALSSNPAALGIAVKQEHAKNGTAPTPTKTTQPITTGNTTLFSMLASNILKQDPTKDELPEESTNPTSDSYQSATTQFNSISSTFAWLYAVTQLPTVQSQMSDVIRKTDGTTNVAKVKEIEKVLNQAIQDVATDKIPLTLEDPSAASTSK